MYHLTVSVGQEFASDLAEWFWLSVSSEAQSSSWLGLQLKAGAGGSASMVLAHTSACWLLAVGPRSLFLPMWLLHGTARLSSLHSNWRPQNSDPRELGRSCSLLHDLVSEATRHHFCHILLITDRSESLNLTCTQGERNWPPPFEGRRVKEFEATTVGKMGQQL